jgi:FkbM family methyltransferase
LIISYSQFGEDLILRKIIENDFKISPKNRIGFYVDIGAYHPITYSNTYYFFLKGWRGINIDARPNSMKLFNKIRDKDINLETAISDKNEILTYYEFDIPCYNTFDKKLKKELINKNITKLVNSYQIKTRTLAEVLDSYLPKHQEIDFFTIDVEGFDLKVLESNDWKKYKPKYILVECSDSNEVDLFNSDIYKFITSKDYYMVDKVMLTLIFKSNNN